jgi:kinesin family member 13
LTLVGRADAPTKQDIELVGQDIAAEHCAFYLKNNTICVTPIKESRTWVNGNLITEETFLNNGDRIVLGKNHFFRLNCPQSPVNSPNESMSLKKEDHLNDTNESNESSASLSSPSSSTALSPSNSFQRSDVSLEEAIKTLEKEYTSLSHNEVDNSQLFTANGLAKLREKILNSNSLVEEAKSLCDTMNKHLKFNITMQIPVENLKPNRDKDSLLLEPFIIIKMKRNPTTTDSRHSIPIKQQRATLNLDQFQSFVQRLRDVYAYRLRNNLDIKENHQIDPIFESETSKCELIGVSNLFFDTLIENNQLSFEYDLAILGKFAQISGRLKIKVACLKDEEKRQLTLRFKIIKAEGPNLSSFSAIICKYKVFGHAETFETIVNNNLPGDDQDEDDVIHFDYEKIIILNIDDKFIEYANDDGSIAVELHGIDRNCRRLAQLGNQLKRFNDDQAERAAHAKQKSLVDCWNEVSTTYELRIEILELTKDGYWAPVDLQKNADDDLNEESGGIYQLKQGQSRQIRIEIAKINKKQHPMWFNGALNHFQLDKIENLSAGAVLARKITTNSIGRSLDSYQEHDLTILKEKCSEYLNERKLYLYKEIEAASKSVLTDDIQNETDTGKDRYESLCKQLAELGEEQASIDAPMEDSRLPGSTINWQPNDGTEKHVPIIFIDSTFNSSDDKSCCYCYGQQSFLTHETTTSKFIDLELIQVNNNIQSEHNDNDNDTDNDDEVINAIARWDSSVHQSTFLNQITPNDKRIYLTLKVNLRMKLNDITNSNNYFNLILRKRLCLNVYLNSSSTNNYNSMISKTTSKFMNLNRFKLWNQRNLI